ncbi:hypothetical protein KC19_VG329700 [Ceratodon purpureus]|uniref:Uncharacterized protein n=1 Tax=Ceratodon purpureus TaxID=3225 RepID=A0A8T0HW20_CERPU|nr:hypothetical protein KC19_VG329700 [Ceratodon purpureus]
MDFATRAVIKLQNNRSQNHCSTNAIIISSSLKLFKKYLLALKSKSKKSGSKHINTVNQKIEIKPLSSMIKPSYERNREKENLDPRPMPSDRWSQLQLKRMQRHALPKIIYEND